MVTLEIGPDDVVVRMAPLDRLVAFKGDVTIERSKVAAARAVSNARKAIEADVRMLGTAIPWLVLAGDFGSLTGGTTFAVAYLNRPGIVLDTTDVRFQRVVLSLDDPHAAVDALGVGQS